MNKFLQKANDFVNAPKQRFLTPAQVAPPSTNGTIRDLSSTYWFGPLPPVNPSAPSTYRPRQYGYTPGSNLIWQPKGESGISFATLRALADSWDLVRIMIEAQKNRIAAKKFEVRAKPKPGEKNKDRKQRNLEDPIVKALNEFLEYPDGIHTLSEWVKLVLEDIIVLDACGIYLERDKKGRVANLMPIAGDTLNRQYTEQGITPPPPNVAYQQVVYGTVAYEFTTNDLVYLMENERLNKRYGFSRIERILITLSIALRRQEFQLQYYTSGNMPEALCFLPNDMPISSVKEIQDWFDTNLVGDLAKRRRLTFLPGYGAGQQAAKPNVVFPKEPLLKDELDVWLAQVAAYNIGVSAQPFLKMMNRASAEQAQEASEEEGQESYISLIEGLLNKIIQRCMGLSDYEVVRQQHRELDVLKQAQADEILVGKIYSINEVREARGEDPRPEPEADMLGVFSATGFIALGETLLQPDNNSGDDSGGNASGKKKPKKKPNGKDTTKAITEHSLRRGLLTAPTPVQCAGFVSSLSAAHRGTLMLAKRMSQQQINQGVLTHTSQEVKSRMQRDLFRAFGKMQTKTLTFLENNLSKLTKNKVDDLADKLMEQLYPEFAELPEEVQYAMLTAIQSGITQGLLQIKVDDQGIINSINSVAQTWAKDRSAELVGMRWKDGELIENPNAEFAITDTTREKLREIITNAFGDDGTTKQQLAEQIKETGVFSEERAEMIAHTEIARAQTLGNLEVWKQSEQVETVEWFTSVDEGVCEECDQNDGEIVALGDEFPSGAESPADTHPNCRCTLAVHDVIGEEE